MNDASVGCPAWILAGVIGCATACTPRDGEPAKTPLPTRETTIDPVVKKLDAASRDIELGRDAIDAQK